MNQATFRTEKPRITDGSLEQQSEKSGPALFSDVDSEATSTSERETS